jgi:hypothetical protein
MRWWARYEDYTRGLELEQDGRAMHAHLPSIYLFMSACMYSYCIPDSIMFRLLEGVLGCDGLGIDGGTCCMTVPIAVVALLGMYHHSKKI